MTGDNVDFDKAMALGAELRARVNLDPITKICPETDLDRLILLLRQERRIELAWEIHRFFDVRRWTKPAGDLSKTDKRVTGMRIDLSDGQKVYSRFSFDRQSYTSKYLKYPISQEEVRKMLSLTGENWQNDGWN